MFGLGRNNNDASTITKSPAKTVKLIKDAAGSAAVSLDTIEKTGGLQIRKKAEAAGEALTRKDLNGIRAQTVVLLDHSGSMYDDYQNGRVQELTERFLAFGLQIDVDGTVPVIPFDSRAKPSVDVTLQNYQGIVKNQLWKPNQMGSTNLADALRLVETMSKGTDAPIFCAIVTDGEPDSRSEATRIICELSRYPVFVKFLALERVSYLQELDDMPDTQRLLDNVDAKYYSNIASVSDEQFAIDMVDEWDSWVRAATAAGILE